MKIRSIGYCMRQGLVNIKRNKLFSFASIGTIAACIFLIGIMMSLIINVNYMEKKLEQKVGVTILFNEGISQEGIDAIEAVIKNDPLVGNYEFTSADEAWESFKESYFKDDPESAELFKDDNPLADSASFTVFLNDIEQQDVFIEKMQAVEGVRKINHSVKTKEALSKINKILGYVSIALIIVLLGVGIFLISNTVMIGISVRQNEIKIMKLIGATNHFVRAPFVIEGVIIGVVGSIIPIGILTAIYSRAIDYVMGKFGVFANSISFAPAYRVMSVVIPVGLIIGVGIGFVGSMLSIRKHLKV